MPESIKKVAVGIAGMSLIQNQIGTCALLLKEIEGERKFPVIIGAIEANAIAMELEGVKPPRPMTHDLVAEIIKNLNVVVDNITITELKNNIFYSSIIVVDSISGETIEIDSRPSDAIAVAVRLGVPIYVSDDLFQNIKIVEVNMEDLKKELKATIPKEGFAPPLWAKKAVSSKPLTKLTKLEQLESNMKKCIEVEDYELAAILRDEIASLKKPKSRKRS